ncbi:Uncharacterised protein [Kingella potus]|uniref:Uncharacterized protein n=2 Tax=Kingella potus TaxID=265175 RepID=A0A377R6V0_9NEIS|nr:Uncharacterised protein [Kingella potus]
MQRAEIGFQTACFPLPLCTCTYGGGLGWGKLPLRLHWRCSGACSGKAVRETRPRPRLSPAREQGRGWVDVGLPVVELAADACVAEPHPARTLRPSEMLYGRFSDGLFIEDGGDACVAGATHPTRVVGTGFQKETKPKTTEGTDTARQQIFYFVPLYAIYVSGARIFGLRLKDNPRPKTACAGAASLSE